MVGRASGHCNIQKAGQRRQPQTWAWLAAAGAPWSAGITASSSGLVTHAALGHKCSAVCWIFQDWMTTILVVNTARMSRSGSTTAMHTFCALEPLCLSMGPRLLLQPGSLLAALKRKKTLRGDIFKKRPVARPNPSWSMWEDREVVSCCLAGWCSPRGAGEQLGAHPSSRGGGSGAQLARQQATEWETLPQSHGLWKYSLEGLVWSLCRSPKDHGNTL